MAVSGSSDTFQLRHSEAGANPITWNNILDVDTSENINFNSGQMYVQKSAGNVGIGTTGPSSRLHVVGADTSTSTVAQIGGSAGTGLVVLNNGYVGIGTTAPATALQVNGQLRFGASSNFFEWTGGPKVYSDRLYSSTGDYKFSSYYGGSEVYNVTIKNDGNVGIGTTNPTSKLQVEGSILLGATDANSYSVTGIDGTTIYNVMYHSGVSGNDDLYFGRRASGTGLVRKMYFRTGANNDTMVLDSAGNVGIGTTGPGYALHIVKGTGATTDNVSLALQNSSVSARGTGIGFFDSNQPLYMGYVGINYSAVDWTKARLSFEVNDDSAGNPIEHMSILSSGNVGIGTTAPGYRLDVQNGGSVVSGEQSISWFGRTGTIEPGVILGYQANGAAATYGRIRSGGANTLGLALGGSGSSIDSVFIKNDGNVGIGTTGPAPTNWMYRVGI